MLKNQFNQRIMDRLLDYNYFVHDKSKNILDVNSTIPEQYKGWANGIFIFLNNLLVQKKDLNIIDESKNLITYPEFIIGVERMRQWAYYPNIIVSCFGEAHQSEDQRQKTYGIKNGDITVDKYIENRIDYNLNLNSINKDQKIKTILCLEFDKKAIYNPDNTINQFSVDSIYKTQYKDNEDVNLIYFNSFRDNALYYRDPTLKDLIDETDKLIDLKYEGTEKKSITFANLMVNGNNGNFTMNDFLLFDYSGANVSTNINEYLFDQVTQRYRGTPYYESLVQWSRSLTEHYIRGTLEFIQKVLNFVQNSTQEVITLSKLYGMSQNIKIKGDDFDKFLTDYHLLFAEFELFLKLSEFLVNPPLNFAYDIVIIVGDNHCKDNNGINNFFNNFASKFSPPEFYKDDNYESVSTLQNNKRIIPMEKCRVFSKPQFNSDTFKDYITDKLEMKNFRLAQIDFNAHETLFIDYPSHTSIDEIYQSVKITKSLTTDCFVDLGVEGRQYMMNSLHQSRLFCLYENNQPKAFCFMTKYGDYDGKESIFIHTLCSIVKGKKYCNKLLDGLVNVYKGYNLVLNVLKTNQSALKCYKRAGFSENFLSQTEQEFTLIRIGEALQFGQAYRRLTDGIGYYY